MNATGQAYFLQTKQGESRLWSWLIAFWFIIMGWIITQQFIAGPIPEVVKSIDPELYQRYMSLMSGLGSDPEFLKIGLFFLGGAALAILTSVLCLVFLTVKSSRQIVGPIALISGIASLYLGSKMMSFPGAADINNVLLEMIGATPIAYMLMLLTFPAALVGVYLVQKFIHKRTIVSLHTAAAKIDWMRIVFAIAVTWGVYAVVMTGLHFSGVSPLQYTFDPNRFFVYALVTLIFIPLQSGTEEIVFRGYLNQAFGHFISNKWIVFAITSVAFASMHLANPESVAGAEQGGIMHLIVMSSYFLFGFLLCILVYYEGGLEAAIGVHAANNMFAAMFVNYEGSVLPTPSMFLATSNAQIDVPLGMLTLGLVIFILLKTRKPVVPAAQIAS